MRYNLLGKSMIAFGVAQFLCSVVAALLLKAMMVDFLVVVVIGLGTSVSGGSVRAARWSVVIMGWYLLLAALLLVVGSLRPELIQIGARNLRSGELPWALAIGAVVAVWSTINIVFLVRAIRSCTRPA